MHDDVSFFFKDHLAALPLYEAFEEKVFSEVEDVRVKVQASQISFYNRHMFSCVSFLRVRRRKELPDPYVVVTFGLGRRLSSSRIAAAVEPYPGRWTHHVVVSRVEEMDDELMGWIREAAVFSSLK